MLKRSSAMPAPGNRLVAGDQRDDGVEAVAARDQLDRVGDHLAAHQRGLHALGAHRDPVADRDRVELHRRSAGRADAGADVVGQTAQVEVARHRVGPGVGDQNQRLFEVFVGQTDGFEVRTRCGPVASIDDDRTPRAHRGRDRTWGASSSCRTGLHRDRTAAACTGFSGQDVPPEDVFNQCVRCGLCLPTCPTYVETLVETSGPRGRIALIRAVAEGQLDLTSPGFMHQMSECLDCRACEAVCPSGRAVRRAARAGPHPDRASHRPPSARRPARLGRALLIGALFSHLWLMRLAARASCAFYQRSGLQAFARSSGLLRALRPRRARSARAAHVVALLRRRRISVSPRRTATRQPRSCMPAASCTSRSPTGTKRRCACSTRAGVEVIVPRGQGCCGAITIHAGEMDRGRALAKRNIEAFERSGADVYVINAAGCGSALKEYGQLFHDDPRLAASARGPSARRFATSPNISTRSASAPGLGAARRRSSPTKIRVISRTRSASRPRRGGCSPQIPGLELREMDESSLCCGSAGIYNVTQPEMAGRLGRRKVERIARRRARDPRHRQPRLRAANRQTGLARRRHRRSNVTARRPAASTAPTRRGA